ncbi:hypothetical protein Q4497_01215 [Mesomycoplasma ovipneumoniae]|uniref:Lipoprotein n=1 Tax=Mesomycoplasma ovipneumoniae TaxID=29562 RepID=A0AAW6Q623_9BACT|nr:hypothetical protein [Mesomycoplasma ovipneumoniae]MDF9628052.1 hypothetical protein [Mesomycoplasma ovipneumoniae]MDO4157925.1 hypothetical protein [Mesomycoplasma ovipneumoniae]MDO4158289.1 hypothetical protein [Mesomycoplasma ovipneumoniae]MDO6821644.1 hypothetical protein [Mesomycoplasma ovipneumoniae]MDO6855548.1 hypothetical protein [Mesomycoplasma ovipneumoniae]
MLHSIYKKLKKQKILLLTTSFLALPALIVSCTDPHQESPKNISKSPAPGQGNNNPAPGQGNNNPEPVEGNNPKAADPEKGRPILEDNSEIITNSVLGFNGQKKNPKVAKNRFDITKNYTEEIQDATFLSDTPGGTGKYGLLPYWYYLQSIPKYLEKNNYIINNKYNKEEYLKRLEYFYNKLRTYWKNNIADYQPQDGGAVEVWRLELINQYKNFVVGKDKDSKENIALPEDLGNNDKVDPKSLDKDLYFSIIKSELDKYNAQIPEDMKYNVVFDFLLGNQRIWPSAVDNVVYGADSELDEARLFRDDLYIEKDYNPSTPEKLWYELGWFMLRPQRIISSANVARTILENIYSIEKNLFDLTNKNESIDKQLKTGAITNFIKQLAVFLSPSHHLSLRKDLIFNIDISNNADDQSLISDFIEYYNQKIVPIIWRIKQTNDKLKITPLTKHLKHLKDLKDDYYFNKYLKDYLPEIKELTSEEDIKNNQTLDEEAKKKAIDEAKKAGTKAWSQWLKTYQEKYSIQFKEEPGIDNEDIVDESSSSVLSPDTTSNSTQQPSSQEEQTSDQTDAQPTN